MRLPASKCRSPEARFWQNLSIFTLLFVRRAGQISRTVALTVTHTKLQPKPCMLDGRKAARQMRITRKICYEKSFNGDNVTAV